MSNHAIQNKFNININYNCSIFIILYFYKGVSGVFQNLNQYSKDTNLLNIERDFEIYYALQENNLSLLKNNLDLNIMFHFKPIERDRLKNQIVPENTNRICSLYHKIEKDFKKEEVLKEIV